MKISAPAVVAAAAGAGAALVTGGVFVLAGPGWAMICSGAELVLFALLTARGLTRG